MNIKNQLVINNPTLMQEWDYTKNNDIGLYADKVTTGSNKVAFWICRTCGNHFSYVIKSKSRAKIGCPKCAYKARSVSNRLTKTKNKITLSQSHPDLVSEWIECVDEELTPYNVTANSNKRVKWKCRICNGEYITYIPNRAQKGSGCPYCAGLKVLAGFNDLQTINPQLAQEWSDKNNCSPTEFLPHSHFKVYWKCSAGHNDYLSSIKSRSYGQGCPVCASESQTSFPEQAIYYFLKQVYKEAENRYRYANKTEIDIFIPSLKIGIEYNGYYSHKNREDKDKSKQEYLSREGITLLVIKEYKTTLEKNGADFYILNNYDFVELDKLINSIFLTLCREVPIEVNTEKHYIAIKEQYLSIRKKNSFGVKMPNLLMEWDYGMNGKINPEFVSSGSNQKFYWKCLNCNNSYLSSTKHRISGTGCPYCSGKKVLDGVNDFATRYPELLKEWDYEKNSKRPNEIYGGGCNTVYFKCKKGHSYKIKIRDKIKGNGCPYCAGKKVLEGFNDLFSQNPDLILDWDYSKNKTTPDKVHESSSKKHFWKCHICGFEWEYSVRQRINCPSCTSANKKINVYTLDGKLIGSYIGRKEVCKALDIQLKSLGNISRICMRKQKTLLSKYILRYDRDDEFKGLTTLDIKNKIQNYLNINKQL